MILRYRCVTSVSELKTNVNELETELSNEKIEAENWKTEYFDLMDNCSKGLSDKLMTDKDFAAKFVQAVIDCDRDFLETQLDDFLFEEKPAVDDATNGENTPILETTVDADFCDADFLNEFNETTT